VRSPTSGSPALYACQKRLEYDESFYGEESKKQQIKEEARLHKMAKKWNYALVKMAS
jgi:hypothetical protein